MAEPNRYQQAARAAMDKEVGESEKDNWIQGAVRPGKEGQFTAKAKKWAGKDFKGSPTVQEYARHVLANKDDFDEETIDQAQFALNMGKLAKKQESS